jgi:hypothetical protein
MPKTWDSWTSSCHSAGCGVVHSSVVPDSKPSTKMMFGATLRMKSAIASSSQYAAFGYSAMEDTTTTAVGSISLMA